MSRGQPGDRGAVTVEAAIAVCTLVVVLTAALGAILATAAHLRCMDAARETARLVARGEVERARTIAEQLAPRDAAVSIAMNGDEVRVEVSSSMLGGAGTAMPRLSASAVAVLEPGVADAPPALPAPADPSSVAVPGPSDPSAPAPAATPDDPSAEPPP
jgi:hypothetical protein